MTATEDVFFQGTLEGVVDAPAHKVTVGPAARVTGDVTAREVVIHGTFHGNLAAAERIEISRFAKVTADVRTSRILIEEGAYFQGSIDIVLPGSTVAKKKAESARVVAEGPSFEAVLAE